MGKRTNPDFKWLHGVQGWCIGTLLEPRLFDKALEFDEKLKEVEEKIMTINMQGIVDGFTKG